MELSRQETIRAAPSVVWAFAIDVESWPGVMDHIGRIERCDHGPFRLGSAARLEQPALPTTTWTVDQFESDESFRWWGRPFGIPMTADHIIEPLAKGATGLTLSVTASGWKATLLGPLLRWATARALRQEFAGFKAACE